MMKVNYLLSLIGLVGAIGFGLILCTASRPGASQTTPAAHPLVQNVRILPASLVNAVPVRPDDDRNAEAILTNAVDWETVVKFAGIDARSEKCVACHFGDGATKEHPGSYLQSHATDVFGCVLCHGGDGQAKRELEAHTSTLEFPFLKGNQVEANCGKCHLEPAVPGALYLSGGRFALHRYGCISCHELPVKTPAERYAPRLDYIGDKVSEAWLHQWLRDPTAYLPASKMPRVELTDLEREAITAFLMTLWDESRLQPIEGKGDPENGGRLFAEYECQSCHPLHGTGDAIGPELERVSEKVNRRWLLNYLKNPAALTPKTRMPNYLLSDQEILDLTDYLLANAPEQTPSLPVRGEKRESCPCGTTFSAENGKTRVSSFNSELQTLPTPAPLPRGDSDVRAESSPPLRTPNSDGIDSHQVNEGFRLYISKGCAQCHGVTKYIGVDVTAQLMLGDIEEAIDRIKAHRGVQIQVPKIDIPESDLELIKVALLALRRSSVHEKLVYRMESGAAENVSEFLADFWQTPAPLQGAPPEYYNETVSQLKPEKCGVCHQSQWQDWQTTRHAVAMGPGIQGQLIGENPDFVNNCLTCHAPLSEQTAYLSDADGEYTLNPRYDDALQASGLVCAACHVRGHQRYGPPFSEEATAASVFAEGHHGGAVVSPAYQDSAFCRPCHQFEEGSTSLNGKLLENTYNEWRESPHAQNGQTCQSCHMPGRRHTWKGVHDPDMVKNALELDVKLQARNNRIEAGIRLTNVGAGHHLPTYVTPAIYVTTRLLDAGGNPVPETEQIRAIQRRVVLTPGDSREVFDTRIPAGGAWLYDYQARRPENATTLEVQVDVHPDEFYNDFFRDYRTSRWEAQVEINKAFQITEESPYLLLTKRMPLEN
jgi:cbb3-type cytochrome oxidase cytochrome c subunit